MTEKTIKSKKTEFEFITCDGKIFKSEEDAMKWEGTYKLSVWTGFDEFRAKTDISGCDLGLPWSNEDAECYLVIPQTVKDIEFLNIFLGIFNDVDRYLDSEDLLRPIVFDLGYDRTECRVYDAEKLIESIEDQYKKDAKKLQKLRKDSE